MVFILFDLSAPLSDGVLFLGKSSGRPCAQSVVIAVLALRIRVFFAFFFAIQNDGTAKAFFHSHIKQVIIDKSENKRKRSTRTPRGESTLVPCI